LLAKGRIGVVVPTRVLEAAEPSATPPVSGTKRRKAPRLTPAERLALAAARKLHAAVDDLTHYLPQLSGSEVRMVRAPSELASGTLPIWVGEAAEAHFGGARARKPSGQAFRFVVGKDGIGLFGESDLATGYAIYELLDRLGCRWFMPGELGEDVPEGDLLTLSETDETIEPSTEYRGLWYADEDFKRRNRLGGVQIAAGHMLEKWVTNAEREEHPNWRAQVKGVPHATRLRWSEPEVADAIADGIRRRVVRQPTASVSISPSDGVDFDDTFDTAIDAKDWDPTVNGVSLTDRLLVLANRVADNLEPDYPDLKLGLLAYVSYTRPPVRENVHPNVVPVIAPITYCRQAPWSDDACPGARQLRAIVTGWSQRADKLAFRGYAFNLAEPAAPNPMMRKWSWDLPFLFEHKVRYFQPETLPNFESSLPALWLGIRLSWDSRQRPALVLKDLFDRFYGHASREAFAYLDLFDHAWTDKAEFSGAGLGYERRFPVELLDRARHALERTKAACRTNKERERVAMLDASLQQLELYMKMARDLREGRLAGLSNDYDRWQARAQDLAERYAPNSAFGKAGWAGPNGVYGSYVKRFLEAVYREADRIAREQVVLTPMPVCHWSYRAAPQLTPPLSGVPERLSAQDPNMNVCTDTWSSIGRHDYFGSMWYEANVDVADVPESKRASLWLSKVDGLAQVWLNDQPVLAQSPTPGPAAETHLKFQTYDVTGPLHAGTNKLSILVKRTRLAELGAGGLMGPAYLYRER
jgi:hypothetical protein